MSIPGHNSLCEARQKIIVSKDSGEDREHRAYNTNLCVVSQYRIDGEVIVEGNRCDYIIFNEDRRMVYLIELKGCRLKDAVVQLLATEETLRDILRPYNIQYRIVASKVKTHAIEDSQFKKFRTQKGNALQYKTGRLEENI